MSALELVLTVAMVIGLVGVLVPFLPGLVLILGAAVVWAMAEPRAFHWTIVAVMAVIAVLGVSASTVLPARRAAVAGASRTSLLAGGLGMVVGFFAIPVIGALIGFPAGIFVGEAVRSHDRGSAWATTLQTLKGVGVGILVQLTAGVAMIGVWTGGLALD